MFHLFDVGKCAAGTETLLLNMEAKTIQMVAKRKMNINAGLG